MRKVIINAIIILGMLILSSCSLGGTRTEMLNTDSDDTKANTRLEQVLEAIKNEDEEDMKAVFSEGIG